MEITQQQRRFIELATHRYVDVVTQLREAHDALDSRFTQTGEGRRDLGEETAALRNLIFTADTVMTLEQVKQTREYNAVNAIPDAYVEAAIETRRNGELLRTVLRGAGIEDGRAYTGPIYFGVFEDRNIEGGSEAIATLVSGRLDSMGITVQASETSAETAFNLQGLVNGVVTFSRGFERAGGMITQSISAFSGATDTRVEEPAAATEETPARESASIRRIPEVMDLQALLIMNGHNTDRLGNGSLNVDGLYGPSTRRAIEAYIVELRASDSPPDWLTDDFQIPPVSGNYAIDVQQLAPVLAQLQESVIAPTQEQLQAAGTLVSDFGNLDKGERHFLEVVLNTNSLLGMPATLAPGEVNNDLNDEAHRIRALASLSGFTAPEGISLDSASYNEVESARIVGAALQRARNDTTPS